MVEKTKILNIEISACKECPYFKKHRVTSWETHTYCYYKKQRHMTHYKSKISEDHYKLGSTINSDCELPDA